MQDREATGFQGMVRTIETDVKLVLVPLNRKAEATDVSFTTLAPS